MNFTGKQYGGKGQVMFVDGVFGTSGPIPPNSEPCDIEIPIDKTLSQEAAKNIVNNGFIHTFDVDNDIETILSAHPVMSLGDNKIKISPQINLNNYLAFSPSSSTKPEDVAQYLVNRVISYKSSFQAAYPSKTFRWSLKWIDFGGVSDGYSPGPDISPCFISHVGDVITKDYEVSSKSDGFWNGLILKFTSGSMIDQTFTISSWINSTKIITVEAMPATPQHGDRFVIIDGLNTYASRVDNRSEVFQSTNTQFRVFSFSGFCSGRHSLEHGSPVSASAVRTTTVFGIQREFESPYPSKNLWLFWKNYESDYFDENKQDRPGFCEITFDDTCKTVALRGLRRKVVGWDPVNCLFTVDPPLPSPPDFPSGSGSSLQFDSFVVRRVRNSGDSSILPEEIFFFKNAKIEVEAWMVRFKNKMLQLLVSANIPEPDMISFVHENLQYGTTSFIRSDGIFSNYELNLQDDRATDPSYTIDGVHTLSQWDELYRKDINGTRLEFPFSYYAYSPLAQDIHSYLLNTWSTAYNYHFSKAVWDHLSEIWPKVKCVQYQLGNGVGSSLGPTQIGPQETSYHGISWNHSIATDSYYSIIPDFNKLSSDYVSAECSTSGFTPTNTQFKITSSNIASIVSLFSGGLPISSDLSFSWRSGPMNKQRYKIVSLQHRMPEDDYILTVNAMSSIPANFNSGIIVGYPNYAYQEYLSYGAKWGLMKFYLDKYNQPSTISGFTNAAKLWAVEKIRTTCKSFPNNSVAVYASCGVTNSSSYDGIQEWFGFEWTYPGDDFFTKDGYLDGNDWGDIITSYMDSGVDQIIWSSPSIIDNSNPNNTEISYSSYKKVLKKSSISYIDVESYNEFILANLDVIYQAILKQKQAYYSNLEIYRKIADGC